MRFMMMVMANGQESAAPASLLQFNEALQRAGVLLALDGLFPPSSAARVSYADGRAMAADEPGAAIAGYWIIQVRTREEAIEWARRAPMSGHETIEVRRIRDA